MLFPFFQWCEATSLSAAFRGSTWAFAVTESIHLLALSVIGGAVLMVNLRLLGFGLNRKPTRQVAADVQPWFVGSWIVMLVTGVLLFFSEPTKCYYSTPFWVKMWSLLLASVFAFTIQRKFMARPDERISPVVGKLVAVVSLLLWFGVGAGGRWIGFSG